MDEEKENPIENKGSSTGMSIWVVLGVIIVMYGAYWVWVAPKIPDDQFDRLNTLFSGLAFWGVIYAILLQKSELSLQRKELALTREEVRGQKEQLEAQNLTMKRQRFENTFFSLLDRLTNMVSSMEIPPHGMGNPTKGRDCFSLFCGEFDEEYQRAKHANQNIRLKVACEQTYARFYKRRQHHVDHYFRTLYDIVRYVDLSQFEDKSLYIGFLRAQLSSSELKLLFYNCISEMAAKKFKPLIHKSGLLKNLREELLIDPGHLSLLEEATISTHE